MGEVLRFAACRILNEAQCVLTNLFGVESCLFAGTHLNTRVSMLLTSSMQEKSFLWEFINAEVSSKMSYCYNGVKKYRIQKHIDIEQ
jgi:hypothetical protein